MIPWFVVTIIDAIAWLFGRSTYVHATSRNWFGAERVFFMPRAPGETRPNRLRAHRGGPLTPIGPADVRRAIAAHVGAETMATLGPS